MASPDYPIKYTLEEAELRTLSQRLLAEQPPWVDERFVGYMVDSTTELSNLGRHVERAVFEEQFGLDDAAMRRLYQPYEAASTFFVVIDRANTRPAGAARIKRHSPAGFLTLNDAAAMAGFTAADFRRHYGVDRMDEVWDLGTTVVLKEYRTLGHHLVSQICYRCLYARAMHEGIKHYVAILDGDIFRTFTLIGLPFHPFPGTGPVSHEGSKDSVFTYGPPAGFPDGAAQGLARVKNPKLKPFIATFKNRVFGPEVDHHLMFDISKCPGNAQKKIKRPERAAADAVAAPTTRPPPVIPQSAPAPVSAKGSAAGTSSQWYGVPKQRSLL